MAHSSISGDVSHTAVASAAGAPPQRMKRNQPGTPSPDAEVIALSPQTLMATNRFVCEVCNKGFQREQNLQLHRRGHNLPWKLKKKSSTEIIRKKVYVCPEPGCLHHDPVRALGDLTGIKKHYLRKHGEKTFRCEKCNKSYAVQSDWKAHLKICGTKEYRCECGITFSRRDSFNTHKGYCDALAQETARHSMIPTSTVATINANASTGVAMGFATAGPILSVDEPGSSGFGRTGRAGGSKTSFTTLLSGQLSVGSAFRPIQPLTIRSPTEQKLTFQNVSDFSGHSSSPYNFNFNVGPGSLKNVADVTDCNIFSGMVNAADQAPVYTLPTPQLYATPIENPSLVGSNSCVPPFVNSLGNSSTCGLETNNYNGGGVLGDGIVSGSGGFQELMFSSMAPGWGSSVYESVGFAGEVENDYGMYNVKSATYLENNRVERQLSVQSGYSDKLTRDFLGVGNRRSFTGGSMEEQMKADSPDSEVTTSVGVVPFVRQWKF